MTGRVVAFIATMRALALRVISALYQKPVWFTLGVGARHGRGSWSRQCARALTVRHCDGGPPDRIAPKTLYDLLGARPDDNPDELKNAFRKAVKAHHPDLHRDDPDASVRLSDIVRAYAILRDARDRAAYDQALKFERGLSWPQPKRTFTNTMHLIFAEVGAVAVLTVALVGGYALIAYVLSQFSEDSKMAAVREPLKTAAIEPTSQRSEAGFNPGELTDEQWRILDPLLLNRGQRKPRTPDKRRTVILPSGKGSHAPWKDANRATFPPAFAHQQNGGKHRGCAGLPFLCLNVGP
ncbi:MAG TPA: DnaJ domain-containing protein [Candidatus Acidoferrum sp.]|nr:DnaJ domain-containing protein [Candidatus Acidoferrum sp.]